MNVMLAAGGYPKTIIPLEKRDDYMDTLESGSVEQDIALFAVLLGRLVSESLAGKQVPQAPAGKIIELIKSFRKGTGEIVINSGPHLGEFNHNISLAELIEAVGTMSSLCIAGKYCRKASVLRRPTSAHRLPPSDV